MTPPEHAMSLIYGGFLIWLGMNCLRPGRAPGVVRRPHSGFLAGFASAATNPMTALFLAATLGRLGAGAALPMLPLLVGGVIVVACIWLSLVAFCVTGARLAFALGGFGGIIARVPGVALVCLGITALIGNTL